MTVPRKPPLQASSRPRVPRQRSGRPELLSKDAELRQPSHKATAARGPAARQPRWGPRRGREAALQMLYQWEVGRADIDSVLGTYWQIDPPGSAPTEETRAFAEQLARGTSGNLTVSDPLIAGEAEHWRLSRMALLDRLILRLAVYEFLHTDTPRAVVINEAIELAKKFSTDDSAKFINGVLDAIRRRVEMKGQ